VASVKGEGEGERGVRGWMDGVIMNVNWMLQVNKED